MNYEHMRNSVEKVLVLQLVGGDKSSQQNDINKAKKLASEL